jgi:hypothetical protein
MTTSEQGAIEMAAGHVYFTAVNGGLDTTRSTSRRASPLTTKGDLYGFSTVDARLNVGKMARYYRLTLLKLQV